jgi:hypothetical protein
MVLQSYVHSKTHPHTLQSIAPVTNRSFLYVCIYWIIDQKFSLVSIYIYVDIFYVNTLVTFILDRSFFSPDVVNVTIHNLATTSMRKPNRPAANHPRRFM